MIQSLPFIVCCFSRPTNPRQQQQRQLLNISNLLYSFVAVVVVKLDWPVDWSNVLGLTFDEKMRGVVDDGNGGGVYT